MRYPALIDFDGDRIVADLPDCPGCQASCGPDQDIVTAAMPVLHRWLESCLVDGTIPPKPSAAVVSRDWFEWIPIPPDLAAKLLLRWAAAKRISRSELARRAGVGEAALATLEDQSAPVAQEVLDGVSRAVGVLVASGTTTADARRRTPPARRRSTPAAKTAGAARSPATRRRRRA